MGRCEVHDHLDGNVVVEATVTGDDEGVALVVGGGEGEEDTLYEVL